MRIRMITHAQGPDLSAAPNTELEVSAEQGAALVEGGYAVALDAEPVSPAGSPKTRERATSKAAGRRARR